MLVASLASGSSGNALLIQAANAAVLVDCGIAVRTVTRMLNYLGVDLDQVQAILLTHEHSDHALSAGPLARRCQAPVVCTDGTRMALDARLDGAAVEVVPAGQRASIGPFDIMAFRVPHDAADPVGYRITAEGVSVGIAVDLGSWMTSIVEALRPCDLLVIEANHDRELLMSAPYPWPTRQRIFGPRGHLDNVQTGELLAQIGSDGRARDVWLAHLSEHANSPRRAVQQVDLVLQMAGVVSGLNLSALPRKSMPAVDRVAVWREDNLLRQKTLL